MKDFLYYLAMILICIGGLLVIPIGLALVFLIWREFFKFIQEIRGQR